MEVEQLCHACEQPVGVSVQTDVAVEQMLEGVVGRIADLGLGSMTSHGSRSAANTLPA